MKRLKIPDVETFIAAIQDEISHPAEGRYYHRLHVVLHALKETSCYEAARIYGHSPCGVYNWIHHLITKGLNGLREEEHPSRPSKLSLSQRKELRKHLLLSSREFAYDQNVWDGPLLSYHLKKYFSVHLRVRQCQNLFHRLGFTLQRPRHKGANTDPEKQEVFKKTRNLLKRCEPRGLIRRRSPFSTSSYSYSYVASVGEQPQIISPATRQKVGFFGAVSLSTDHTHNSDVFSFQCQNVPRFSLLFSRLNSQTYSSHLGSCQLSPSKRLETVPYEASGLYKTVLFACVFPRAQSYRESLEDYTPTSHSQPLLLNSSDFEGSPYESVCSVEILQ